MTPWVTSWFRGGIWGQPPAYSAAVADPRLAEANTRGYYQPGPTGFRADPVVAASSGGPLGPDGGDHHARRRYTPDPSTRSSRPFDGSISFGQGPSRRILDSPASHISGYTVRSAFHRWQDPGGGGDRSAPGLPPEGPRLSSRAPSRGPGDPSSALRMEYPREGAAPSPHPSLLRQVAAASQYQLRSEDRHRRMAVDASLEPHRLSLAPGVEMIASGGRYRPPSPVPSVGRGRSNIRDWEGLHPDVQYLGEEDRQFVPERFSPPVSLAVGHLSVRR